MCVSPILVCLARTQRRINQKAPELSTQPSTIHPKYPIGFKVRRRRATVPQLLTLVAIVISSDRPPKALAQWNIERFELKVGWNAIYLDVEPATPVADSLFAGTPVEAVWHRFSSGTLPRSTTCQDKNEIGCAVEVPEWGVWVPQDSPERPTITLRRLDGGQSYLIKTSLPFVLSVIGSPNGNRTTWKAGATLAGLHVTPDISAAPTFGEYFAGSAELTSASIYEVDQGGSNQKIPNAVEAQVAPGRAYWFLSDARVEYDGPIELDRPSCRGINFGHDLVEHPVFLKNQTASAKQATIRYLPSEAPPPNEPANAGPPPLKYFRYGTATDNDRFTWQTLNETTRHLEPDGHPGAGQTLQLTVVRAGLAPAFLQPDGNGSQYQGLLEITDNNGFRRLVSVSSQVRATGGLRVAASGGAGLNLQAGLWIGRVAVNRVSWWTAGAKHCEWDNEDENDPLKDLSCESGAEPPASDETLPTGVEFVFPVLIHVNDGGEATFLTEATLMRYSASEGTEEHVLVTSSCPDSSRSRFKSGTTRSGEPFSIRFSTSAFAFEGDLPMQMGALDDVESNQGTPGLQLSASILVDGDHRLSPTKHKYHPDHDDCGPSGGECFDIKRDVQFKIDSFTEANAHLPGAGDVLFSGKYTETIAIESTTPGEFGPPIYVSGRVTLHLAPSLRIARLNVGCEIPQGK